MNLTEQHNSENEACSWGLSAFGRAGQVNIELLEALPPALESWELQISAGSMTFGMQIASPDMLSQMLEFMKANYGQIRMHKARANEYRGIPEGTPMFSMVAQIDLSPSGSCQVHLSKDGELPDRFIFSLASPEHRISFDLHDPQVAELIAALENTADSLAG
jgi:hypothetical protein